MPITHSYVSPVDDEPGGQRVKPQAHWNAAHVVNLDPFTEISGLADNQILFGSATGSVEQSSSLTYYDIFGIGADTLTAPLISAPVALVVGDSLSAGTVFIQALGVDGDYPNENGYFALPVSGANRRVITRDNSLGIIHIGESVTLTESSNVLKAQNLNIGIPLGTGTVSALNVYSAYGDYTTGTATATNGSLTVTGSGTTWVAGVAGKYIKFTGESVFYKINNRNSNTQLTLTRAYQGTTGSGKSYTIYGGEINWDSTNEATLDFNFSNVRATKGAFGTGSTIGAAGTFGGYSVLDVKETFSPQVLAFPSAMLFTPVLSPGNGFAGLSAFVLALETEALTINQIVTDMQLLVPSITHTGGAISTFNFQRLADAGTNSGAGTVTSCNGISIDVLMPTKSVTTMKGINLLEQASGSTNWQIYSQSGNWYLGDDNSQIVFGTGSDFAIYYTGTNMVFDPLLTTSAIVFNESGLDTDFRIEGDTDANCFYLDAGNNRVGIGTATPGYKFDVSGDANVSGVYRVGGTSGFTGTGAYTNFTITGGIITAAS